MTHNPPTPITDYIMDQPPEVQAKLNQMRDAILEIAPESTEKISWRMPTFDLNGNLVHFAAFKNHVGFYPGAEGVETFAAELGALHFSKGAIQFPYDQPLPLDHARRIAACRKEQNLAKKK